MIIKQISVFIENKSGRLENVTSVLKDAQINILAMSIADTTNFGILRLIVCDYEKAEKVLKENGFTVKATDVLGVSIPHSPGGLHQAVEILTRNNLAIDYMYAFVGDGTSKAYVIIKTDDNSKAAGLLHDAGIPLVGYDEISQL